MSEDAILTDEATSKRPYWLQRADLSSRDYPPVSLPEAEIALLGHNWQLEHALFNRLEETKGDNCPAGIGFVDKCDDPDYILHICPKEDGTALCFFHDRGTMYDHEAVSVLGQYRLLQLFFRSDYKALVRGLRGEW